MTSFIDCIRSSVESGRITSAKGQKAEDAYNRAYENGVAEGLSENAARDAASNRAVESMAKLNAQQRWKRINEIRKAHDIHQRLSRSNNLPRDLDDIADSWEIAYNRIRGQAMSYLNALLEEYRPRAAGLIHPTKGLDEVIRASYGEKVSNPTSKELADSISDTREFLRKRANMEGASIPDNPNNRIPQTHDRAKVRAVPKQEWIDDHLENLDWEIMRYDDEPIPVDRRQEILGRVYDGIATDGYNRVVPGQGHIDHLSARLSKERFLYYRNADSYISMQNKYGSGNIHQQMIAIIDSMSKDISMLEKLGPNPAGMKTFLGNVAERRAAELDLERGATKRKSRLKQTQEALENFSDRYDIHNRFVLNGEENWLAQGSATIRTSVMGTILSGAYLANLGDLGIMKHAALTMKLPMTRQIRSYVNNFVPNKANRQIAVRSGLIAESATQLAASHARYFGPLDGAHWAKRYSDVVNRAGLLTPHTQAAKWAWGMELIGTMADHYQTQFDDLPFSSMFSEYGITREDWDLLRSTPLYNDRGAPLLRPMDLWLREDGNVAQNKRVADKFLDMIQGTTRIAVPSVTQRVQVTLGQATSPNTIRGQLLRMVGSLKSFPVTLMMLHGRDMINKSSTAGKLGYAASFFTFLTLGGAFITQLKHLANGRDPQDMTQPEFWGRSVLNGGSLGILGDMVFNNINAQSGLAQSITGPIVQWYDDARDLTLGNVQELMSGEKTNFQKEFLDFTKQYGPRVWQIRLIMQRMFFDQMLKSADPAAYRRLQSAESRRMKDRNQESWWKPGAPMPERAPNMNAVVGGSR